MKDFKFQILNFKLLNIQPTTYNPQLISAFTLIELIVSISIIVLLMGVTFAGLTRFNQRQKLVAAGQNIRNLVRDVQSRAYNGEMDCAVCDCVTNEAFALKGWTVDYAAMQIYGSCRPASGPEASIIFSRQDWNLGDQIKVNYPSGLGNDKVTFFYYPPSADKESYVCLSQANLDGFYQIMINRAGTVSDSNGIIDECP